MTKGSIEHVNLAVSDIHRSARLFTDLMGWKIRWSGKSRSGGDTIHLGDADTYLAFWSDGGNYSGQTKGCPLNHIGLLVDDLAAAESVVEAHGLTPFGHDDYDPGRRFYFFDWDGIEFELVNYD